MPQCYFRPIKLRDVELVGDLDSNLALALFPIRRDHLAECSGSEKIAKGQGHSPIGRGQRHRDTFRFGRGRRTVLRRVLRFLSIERWGSPGDPPLVPFLRSQVPWVSCISGVLGFWFRSCFSNLGLGVLIWRLTHAGCMRRDGIFSRGIRRWGRRGRQGRGNGRGFAVRVPVAG